VGDQIESPDDPRLGAGSLQKKLEHQTTQRAHAEGRCRALERQLRSQAQLYQKEIRNLNEMLDKSAKRLGELQAEIDFFNIARTPEQLADAEKRNQDHHCMVDLCTKDSVGEGFCEDHQWILDDKAHGPR